MNEKAVNSMILVAAANAPEDNIASRLSMILRDIAPATRVEAITSLGQMGDVAAVEAIIPTLPSEMLQPVLSALHEAEMDAAFLPGENRRKRLLISDMDSTIIGQECLDELADFAGLKAEVSAITERAMRGELDFEGALTTRVAMLKGLDLKALQDAYDARITLNTGAKTLVETMKANGAVTVLVSGGFTFFTGRVAEEAGFVAHRGNTLIDDGAALTGEVGLPILGREAKLSALDEVSAENGLGRADAIALGDGANDLAMIKAAGLGIAYKAKPIVAAEAHAAITHTDLHTALFFQGYHVDEFVTG
ncbi:MULTISPECIES: phosphoserine phosphatase SerB [unclassified Hyphomonas]|uniref:phosphoserine phosphatase SerB n=1 Tax=unclassified Hyphomonas TaxID=2630699 RepID=UPI002355E07F|nr:phosphoserine phosphatase SerB [Hyphomonas sp.]